MHDSVGQFQTIYVNLDICHEPLVSNRWYQKPKIPSSLPVVARQALLENLIKFRICKIFLLLIKKKEFDVLTAFITKCHHIFNCLHRR